MSTKAQFVLSDEAMEVINRSATERRRGEWISGAVVEYDRIISGQSADVECGAGVLERIDARMSSLEKQVGLLVSNAIK